MKVAVLAMLLAVGLPNSLDPYAQVPAVDKAILQPQIDRWVRDELTQNWADLWEIEGQTSEMKNELLLGRRDAADLTRAQFVQAMRETMDVGYPLIRAFAVIKVLPEKDGYVVVGCGRKTREEWHQTNITDVHIRMIDGKPKFGLHGGSPEPCKI